MRVGLMTREYPPYVYGGAGVHVEYLSRELAKRIEVEVHAWGKQPEQGIGNREQGIEGLETLDVHFEQPWSAITDGTDAKFKGALEALSLNLLENLHLDKLDIVHTHTWYVSMAGFLAKKLYGIPFVLTTHSLEPLRAWKAEQLGSGYALSSWMERTAILDADAIIAVSNGTKADIQRAYPDVDAAKIHVIYNGIDLQQYQFDPSQEALTAYGVDASRPYVLFVGRITRQKGVMHLVDAVKFLPAGTQVVLCAGAPDTPEIAAEMRAGVEAAQAAGADIVWIEKMVTKAEAIQLYSHCAVFCCPSVYEPFGIINLEAMACGAPVVASATGGILEVVVDTDTGYLVPFVADDATGFPSEPEQFARDLATKLSAVLDNPDRAKSMGKAGRARVEAMFSWTAIAEQTIALYEKLVSERSARA
jgi:starch synthase